MENNINQTGEDIKDLGISTIPHLTMSPTDFVLIFEPGDTFRLALGSELLKQTIQHAVATYGACIVKFPLYSPDAILLGIAPETVESINSHLDINTSQTDSTEGLDKPEES